MSAPARSAVAAGLLRRLRPVLAVGIDELTDVAMDVLPALATTELRLGLFDLDEADPVLVVEEGERSQRAGLRALAAQMTAAGVPPTVDALTAALHAWVARRPVTDATAAAEGVAILDWADADRCTVGWCVAVRRGDLVVGWRPSAGADSSTVHRTRSAALGRAFSVPGRLSVDGQVAVWSCDAAPLLGTAALVDPGRLRRDVTRSGLQMRDAHVVVSPGRPVACADAGVARRLAGDAVEPAVLLPWGELGDLRWRAEPVARPE